MNYKPCRTCDRYVAKTKTCNLSGHEVYYCRTDPHDECGPNGDRWTRKTLPKWVYVVVGAVIGAALGLLF